MIWHGESTKAILDELHTDGNRGLSAADAAERLLAIGENIPQSAAPRTGTRRFSAALRRPAMLAFLAVMLLILVYNVYLFTAHRRADFLTPCVLLVLALLRCLFNAADMRREDAPLPAVHMLTPTAHVIRDGVRSDMPASGLVPGDVVELAADDVVPADCRLLTGFELHCDESSVTGDPLPVHKDAEAAVSAIAPLSERRNMLYAGGVVLHGQARAVVVETGRTTEQNKLSLLRAAEKESALPLQSGPAALARSLIWPALVCGIAAVILSVMVGLPLPSALLFGAALGAAIPAEEIIAAVPGTLAVKARRLTAHGVIVNRAAVTEEIGRTTVLCSDKTGSFTQNVMTLSYAYLQGRLVKLDDNALPEDMNSLLQLSTLCTLGDGNATDEAIIDYAARRKMPRQDLIRTYPRMGLVPVDGGHPQMTAIHLIEGQYIVIVKGAPETVLPLCRQVPEDLDDARNFLGAQALRTLAVAYAVIPEVPARCVAEELEHDLYFVGLLGLADPPHEDTAAAVATCRAAGVRPVMMTGDGKETAMAIARRVGLISDGKEAISGEEVAVMSDSALSQAVERYSVFARVSPADRQRVIRAFKSKGHLVTATGDDTSDVASLRTADIGCAMIRGSADVVAATADVALTHGTFASLVDAVRTGRSVFDNLRYALGYWIARYLGLVLAVFAALIGRGEQLLSPAMLMWTSLVTGVAATTLRWEPATRATMRRAPRHRSESVFAHGLALPLFGGFALAGVCLWLLISNNAATAFAALMAGQAVLGLICRTNVPFVLSRPLRAARTLAALALAAAALLCPLFIPALTPFVGFAAADVAWQSVALWSGVLFLACEAVKFAAYLRLLTRRG